MLMANLHILHDSFQQSPWLDNISRHFLEDGTVAKLIQDGVRGVTSNPTIFEKALADSTAYDAAIHESQLNKASAQLLYWQLAVDDIQRTADLLRPTFDESGGQDGFVSLEVSPELAQNAATTIAQGHDLWQRIDRPNLMIKIPATEACLPAITQLTSDGLNVNITLIFSLERYRQVIDAYLTGLENRSGDLHDIHSVASFFISRVDSNVDAQLDQIDSVEAHNLKGRTGIAQGWLAYQLFQEAFTPDNERWSNLQARGANLQRPLWASTSVKNPDYDPLLYVKGLLAPNTVNTLPNGTIDAIEHAPYDAFSNETGITADKISDAAGIMESLHGLGININGVTDQLEAEGVQKFHESFESMISTLTTKMPD
jgi:transaldolase